MASNRSDNKDLDENLDRISICYLIMQHKQEIVDKAFDLKKALRETFDKSFV
jgi:hypothetical protein